MKSLNDLLWETESDIEKLLKDITETQSSMRTNCLVICCTTGDDPPTDSTSKLGCT